MIKVIRFLLILVFVRCGNWILYLEDVDIEKSEIILDYLFGLWKVWCEFSNVMFKDIVIDLGIFIIFGQFIYVELYKLFIYEEGVMFKVYIDMEKIFGMFGIFIIFFLLVY